VKKTTDQKAASPGYFKTPMEPAVFMKQLTIQWQLLGRLFDFF
jgi:hypothetical protein